MLSACFEVVTGREPDMLRAYLLAVLIQMVVVNTMAEYGSLNVTIPLFYGFATALGGFVFGLGMVLAVGCAGSVLYRAGEGKLDYVFVVTAYSIGAWAGDNWLVEPLRRIIGSEGTALTLHHALIIDRWLVIAVVVVGVTLWVIRGKRRPYFGGWDWARTGILLGMVGVAAWETSALVGRPAGLGTVQGSNNLATILLESDLSAIDWSLFFVLGIPLGSFIASMLHGKSPGKPFRSERIPHALTGGTLMGLGAIIAAGDNVVHGLSGVPLLAMGSFTFMICIFIGSGSG
jgi:hypothetical protein